MATVANLEEKFQISTVGNKFETNTEHGEYKYEYKHVFYISVILFCIK
jgi:hypothetical protein